MSNSNKSDDHQPSNGNEPVEPASEEEDADEIYRNYSEGERPILRSRAQRALRDVTEMFEREDTDAKTRRDVESAIDHLERIVECLADEPLPSISAEALDIEDWIEYDELRYQHGVNGSMPVLLDAFVILVESGVVPGQWILGPLANAFNNILNDRDPELVATRLGLQAKGSGSTSPLKEYTR